MGNLARKLKTKEPEQKKESSIKKGAKEESKVKVTLDQEMIDLLVETEKVEEDYASARKEFEEAISSIKKKFKIEDLGEKISKLEEKKTEIAKSLFSHIRDGGKSEFKIVEKLGRKTPKYKDMCEEFVKDLPDLIKDPKWFTQKKTSILESKDGDVIAEE